MLHLCITYIQSLNYRTFLTKRFFAVAYNYNLIFKRYSAATPGWLKQYVCVYGVQVTSRTMAFSSPVINVGQHCHSAIVKCLVRSLVIHAELTQHVSAAFGFYSRRQGSSALHH